MKCFNFSTISSCFLLQIDDDDYASSHTETESTTDVEIPMEVDSSTEDEIYSNPHLVLEQEKSVEEISLIFNDYCGTALQSQNPMHLNKEIQTELCMKILVDASTQTDKQYKETSSQTFMPEKNSIGLQVTRPDIAFEDIEKDKNDVMFYTGIPNAGTFYTLFDEMNDMYENAEKDGQMGRPRVLRKIDEFFLVLIRLRLGLLIEDLSQRFHISKSTCGDIINKWITYLSVKLSFLTPWPSKHVIQKTLPGKFQRYPRCRVIIDCTEIFTQTPQSLQYKSLMYSHYKSHMTYKSLLGISPNGVITFASDLWVGSISDKQLTKACGILDLLEPGDQLMADKGFLISDLTTERGVELVIPPLKNKKFMRREIEETRRIANLRIYVEMAIARVKNFRILQGVMPITLSQQASQIWKICVGLTNLQPPLVNKN